MRHPVFRWYKATRIAKNGNYKKTAEALALALDKWCEIYQTSGMSVNCGKAPS